MLYDKIFFHDQIQLWDKNARNTIEFRFGRGTKTAGLCEYTTYSKGRATFNECTIKISRPLFRKAYAKGGSHIANGIRCNDKLTAIMVTLEHELMHFLIYANPKINDNKRGKVYGSHGILFQDLTRSYFGHTKTYHELLVN